MKTLKLCREPRVGKIIPPRHPIAAWLVAYCDEVMRFRVREVDGKTPYERARFTPFNSKLVCFAEKVAFKDRAKEDRGDERKWHQGIFLGMCPMTGQDVVYHEEIWKIHKARNIKMLPVQSKWDLF